MIPAGLLILARTWHWIALSSLVAAATAITVELLLTR